MGGPAICEHGTQQLTKEIDMARRNDRTMNVKIPTVKVIAALESKLTQIKGDYVKQDEYEKQYQKQYETWRKQVVKFAVDNISNAENLRTNYTPWRNTLNVDFDLKINETEFPKEPGRDYQQMNSHAYEEMVEEINSTIRILKLTDEEVVSTSTYNSIARYL
jgi:predicted nucleic acid-binding protein